jgi:hypothetical protein
MDSMGIPMSARPIQTTRTFPFKTPTPGVAPVAPSSLTCLLDELIVTTGALLVVGVAIVTAVLAPALAALSLRTASERPAPRTICPPKH